MYTVKGQLGSEDRYWGKDLERASPIEPDNQKGQGRAPRQKIPPGAALQ